jgi:Tol biopolymer transport system component
MRIRTAVAAAAAVSAVIAAPVQATFPGANGKLVLTRVAGNQLDLVTLGADGTGEKKIRSDRRRIEEAATWSPDGRRIAFALSAPKGHPTEVVTVDENGGDLRRVTRFGSVATEPNWSPAGDRLVFFSDRGAGKPVHGGPPPAELYTVGTDGSALKRMTSDRQIQTDPVWSPDGRTIAYAQWRAVRGQRGVFDMAIFLRDADGSNPRPLTRFSARRDTTTPSWSPDGRSIVFAVAHRIPGSSSPGRQSDLAVINADGTGERMLTRTPAFESNPVWSPDGRLIAFTSDHHVRSGPEPRVEQFELYTMAADGTAITRLTRNRTADLMPDWQPLP